MLKQATPLAATAKIIRRCAHVLAVPVILSNGLDHPPIVAGLHRAAIGVAPSGLALEQTYDAVSKPC